MSSFLNWGCIVLTAVSSALAAPPRATLRGAITDSEGAAIRNARVLVHWDSSGAAVGLKSNIGLKQDLSVETNEKGEFTLALPPGFYDVFVSATGFTPDARKILLRPGEVGNYKAKLKVDSLIVHELGDTILR